MESALHFLYIVKKKVNHHIFLLDENLLMRFISLKTAEKGDFYAI